jgi:FkbM family methyltransferase
MKKILDLAILRLLDLLFNHKGPTTIDIFFAYRLFLNRLPDDQGWRNYREANRNYHFPLQWLIDCFLKSQEFQNLHNIQNYLEEQLTYDLVPIVPEVVSLSQFSIFVDTKDTFIGDRIRKEKQYEPEVTKVIGSILKRGHIFVDIGANIGYFSLLGASLVGPQGRVIAFEPMSQNYCLLEKSISLNHFQNIELHKVAVLNENKMVDMLLERRSNSGSFTISDGQKRRSSVSNVTAVRVDDILGTTKVDLIKMDVEGSEGLVFHGMLRTIANSQPTIIMEYSPLSLLHISKITGDDLLDNFTRLNYSFQDVRSFTGRFFSQDKLTIKKLLKNSGSEHCDLLLFPNSLIDYTCS